MSVFLLMYENYRPNLLRTNGVIVFEKIRRIHRTDLTMLKRRFSYRAKRMVNSRELFFNDVLEEVVSGFEIINNALQDGNLKRLLILPGFSHEVHVRERTLLGWALCANNTYAALTLMRIGAIPTVRELLDALNTSKEAARVVLGHSVFGKRRYEVRTIETCSVASRMVPWLMENVLCRPGEGNPADFEIFYERVVPIDTRVGNFICDLIFLVNAWASEEYHHPTNARVGVEYAVWTCALLERAVMVHGRIPHRAIRPMFLAAMNTAMRFIDGNELYHRPIDMNAFAVTFLPQWGGMSHRNDRVLASSDELFMRKLGCRAHVSEIKFIELSEFFVR